MLGEGGKHFDLTFEEFMEFLEENPDYLKKKGISMKSLQIDRDDNLLGYTKGNIKSITMKENLYKEHYVDQHWQSEDPNKENFCPF